MGAFIQERFISRVSEAARSHASRERRTTVQRRDIGVFRSLATLSMLIKVCSDGDAKRRRVLFLGRSVRSYTRGCGISSDASRPLQMS